jgi:hypothetical protein
VPLPAAHHREVGFDASLEVDLPLYIPDQDEPAVQPVKEPAEPRPRLEPVPEPSPATSSFVRPLTKHTPLFIRLVDVPGATLAPVLAAWWGGTATTIRVGRLTFSAPRLERGLWALPAELRVHRGSPTIPVTVELWAHSEAFTHMTMSPKRRVTTSRAYFRAGNRALDRLTDQLTKLTPS